MVETSQIDLSYLRIPLEVAQQVQLDQKFIYGKDAKGKPSRNIFGKVTDWTEDERHKLQQFKHKLLNCHTPIQNYSDIELLRYLYADINDLEKGIRKIHYHIDFKRSHSKISKNAINLLKEGVLYFSGRDIKLRPTIVIDFEKMLKHDYETEKDDLLIALDYMSEVVKKYYFVPGHVEKCVFIVDVNDSGVTNFPFASMKDMFHLSGAIFPRMLYHLFLLNPSFSLKMVWTIIEGFLEENTKQKLDFLQENEFDKMIERGYFHQEQLEQRFGGTMKNISTFWPPQNTLTNEYLQRYFDVTALQLKYVNFNLKLLPDAHSFLQVSQIPLINSNSHKIFEDNDLNSYKMKSQQPKQQQQIQLQNSKNIQKIPHVTTIESNPQIINRTIPFNVQQIMNKYLHVNNNKSNESLHNDYQIYKAQQQNQYLKSINLNMSPVYQNPEFVREMQQSVQIEKEAQEFIDNMKCQTNQNIAVIQHTGQKMTDLHSKLQQSDQTLYPDQTHNSKNKQQEECIIF